MIGNYPTTGSVRLADPANAPTVEIVRLASRPVLWLEQAKGLDVVAKPVATAVSKVVRRSRSLHNLLSGTPFGHPLHPVLTDVTIGAFTMGTFLDLVGGRRAAPAADLLVGVGAASAVPTALTGANDWSDTTGGSSRVGLVHAAANSTALTFFILSLLGRRSSRSRRIALRLLGLGALSFGGDLGGHLAYTRAVGVNHAAFERLPKDWTPVMADAELDEGVPRGVTVDGVPLLLVRDGGQVRALAGTCSHLGGPLHEGEVRDGCVTCPRHGSTFRLADGEVVAGPATAQQPVLETRVQGEQIEVRAQPTA
ncbi:MAG TPA: Rieske (2Fe-2S) protein [Actinomycetales bacterium]|nr:Rieske (2Fe-2S) protein [Actinomycetales bacterium]